MTLYRLFSILLLLGILAGCGRQQPVQTKQSSGPIQVGVAPVVTREIRRVVESVGTLFPYDESTISAEIDGRVEEVTVDLGDQVPQGTVMVRVADEEQKYLVAQNEAQLRQAMERLGLKGEDEKVPDVRETPEPRRAAADLFDAEQRYKRTLDLKSQGIASQADLDAALARYNSLKAAYDSTLYQTRNLVQMVEQFKAQLQLQRKKLRDTSVRAPFSGAVKERMVTVGQYVRVNTPLLTLVRIDPIRLRLEVPERMAPWIKNGQIAEVSIEAFEGRKFTGKIWRISPTVDQSKRTFVVEALIDNPKGELKPGSYARARVPTDHIESIKLIPLKAVNYVFGANKAYVIASDTVEAREVRLGDRFDQEVEVIEGMRDGEQVATTQLPLLDSGTKVRTVVAAAPANRPES